MKFDKEEELSERSQENINLFAAISLFVLLVFVVGLIVYMSTNAVESFRALPAPIQTTAEK